MPKGLCITALVISALVLVLFLSDLVLSFAGLTTIAPFKGASALIDIVFAVCAGIVAFLSWQTFKEQV